MELLHNYFVWCTNIRHTWVDCFWPGLRHNFNYGVRDLVPQDNTIGYSIIFLVAAFTFFWVIPNYKLDCKERDIDFDPTGWVFFGLFGGVGFIVILLLVMNILPYIPFLIAIAILGSAIVWIIYILYVAYLRNFERVSKGIRHISEKRRVAHIKAEEDKGLLTSRSLTRVDPTIPVVNRKSLSKKL